MVVKMMPRWWVVIAMIYWEWTLFKRTDTAHNTAYKMLARIR